MLPSICHPSQLSPRSVPLEIPASASDLGGLAAIIQALRPTCIRTRIFLAIAGQYGETVYLDSLAGRYSVHCRVDLNFSMKSDFSSGKVAFEFVSGVRLRGLVWGVGLQGEIQK